VKTGYLFDIYGTFEAFLEHPDHARQPAVMAFQASHEGSIPFARSINRVSQMGKTFSNRVRQKAPASRFSPLEVVVGGR